MLVPAQGPRDSEVGHQRVAVPREQQVLRLDVPVHHTVLVGVLERLGGLPGDPHRVLHRQLPLPPQPVAQRLTLDKRHGEPELAGGLARVVDGQDVGMLEPGGELNLVLEPLGAERGSELGVEHLERDRSLVLDVAGEIDRRHAPASELALEHVAVAQASSQRGGQVGERR